MNQKLQELELMILDPKSRFSASAARADLIELLKYFAAPSPERGKVLQLAYLVEYKIQQFDIAIDYGIECHGLNEKFHFLKPLAHFNMCFQIGSMAAQREDYETAVDFLTRAHEKHADRPDLTDDQILGIQEKLAHALHEVGAYEEALEVNLRVLEGGEKLFGPHSEVLYGLLNNIAQNYYGLKEMAPAEMYLHRYLEIAKKHAHLAKEYEAIFQLGVLCTETGREKDAVTYFKRQMAIAEELDNDDMLEQAAYNLKRAQHPHG